MADLVASELVPASAAQRSAARRAASERRHARADASVESELAGLWDGGGGVVVFVPEAEVGS